MKNSIDFQFFYFNIPFISSTVLYVIFLWNSTGLYYIIFAYF